jgi:hypothetical protein
MPRKTTLSKVCVAGDQAVKASVAAVIDDKPLVLEVDLLHAINSLYDDHLRPYGRLIRKRLGEDAELKGTGAVDGNLGRLRAACEGSRKIRVEAEADGEWSAVLIDRTQNFVDFYSHDDPYPEEMWKAAGDYFEEMERENGSLPGGRYATALALMKLRPFWLSTYSLGQVCHVVELAMTTRKLLGYLEGAIVPYACSHSKVKDSAAERRVGNGNASQQLPLATWDVARTCLREILASATRKGKASVPLSTLKRLYRSRFHTELSETALGYTKLTELLQDPRIADLCTVRLLEQGYVLTPGNLQAEMHFQQMHAEMHFQQVHLHQHIEQELHKKQRACIDEPEPLRLDDALQPSHEVWVPSKWESLTAANFAKDGCIGSMVQNTFIHVTEQESPRNRRRSKSVPKNMGSRRCAWESSCHALAFMPRSTNEASFEKESQVLSSSNSTRSLFSSSADWDCSIDLDLALEGTENAGMMSGSFCEDPITFDDLASCMTFCVEENNNLECEMENCSSHFPMFLSSPALTASPWGTPMPHSGWVPAVTDSYDVSMPLSETMPCSGPNSCSLNFASCPAVCVVSLNETNTVHKQTQSSGSDPTSPVLTASPQWTPRLDSEGPCEEPKTVLRLVDLL